MDQAHNMYVSPWH